MKPNGTLVLQLSPWGEDPMKRCQAAEKFFPVNGHKFLPKVKQISFLYINKLHDRLLMNLYSARPVETSYGALENRY